MMAAAIVRQADLADAAEVQRIEDYVARIAGTPFHRPAWLKAIEQGTGQAALGLIAEDAREICGWLPLTLVHSPIFGRVLASSGFAVGGGVLSRDEAAAKSLCRTAERLATQLSCPAIELRGGVAPRDWHHVTDSHCGFVGALAADDDAQLTAIPRKQRAEVRKGLKADLSVTIGTDEAERAAHYAVYAESVRNLGTPVFPRALFDAVLDRLDADILTVRHQGEPVASVLSLYHGGAVMPYWGGGTYAARVLRANDRMYFALMCHARARGCQLFDFGRSKTGSGPYHFKRNWGFDPEPLSYASWTAPGAEKRDVNPTSGKHVARIALWKKLPLPVANLLGPWIARGLG
ncbi:FemAB family XrtA/PEP-CTERM system-associated protein [Altericroceibacterium endophyticum]|uniref:FemAB family PEP-CTERM system-associated protein n=1 Tax=Altericroceibacterium endophyticum TaxID=1808508 RepID=A0A6I4T559_9SPHN|nr:FemAB family XrtA/PEP-CTERM system-associated protein [Altericroceibacterium endophyticum]MXO66026.1 FemAB family PEP-CTERM system-associated protein [Altericroceibacterium endophyticum]